MEEYNINMEKDMPNYHLKGLLRLVLHYRGARDIVEDIIKEKTLKA